MSRNNKGLAQAMKNVCKKHQPEEDLLFGSAVHKALTEIAETISSLKKVSEKVDQSSSKRSSDKNKQFFRHGSALDPGWGWSKIYRPSRNHHRSTNNYTSRKSFNRNNQTQKPQSQK